MAKVKTLLVDLSQREYFALGLLILVILALHLSTIAQPDRPIFDEQYYVPAANSILQGTGTDRIEHPPLAQLIIASGIWLFGNNPLGWRLLSVIFGVIGLILFFLIGRQLGLNKRAAFLATFLLSFENLSFIQASVAMLDVFSMTFMLAAFWLYLKRRNSACGVMVGLATLSKLTGILAAPIIITHWLVTDRRRWRDLIVFIVTAASSFWLLMPLLEYAVWHSWLNPVTQVQFMLKANALATFRTSLGDIMLSRPWDWITHPVILTYWIDPHYLSMISPPIWALIVPAVIFAVFAARKNSRPALFALIWFAGTYLLWIAASLIADRISYVFYFYPAMGAICLMLAVGATKIENIANRQAVSDGPGWLSHATPVYLAICLGAFAVLSPVAYWWKLPLCLATYLLMRWFTTAGKETN